MEMTEQMKFIYGPHAVKRMEREAKEAARPSLKMHGDPLGGPEDPRHGTLTGYGKGCRLECCRSANSNAAYIRKYGMPKAGKEAMLASQGGVCASCGVDDPGSVRGWHIDHDHVTGKVRSILCHACNVSYGLFKENVERIEGFLAYAQKHQRSGF